MSGKAKKQSGASTAPRRSPRRAIRVHDSDPKKKRAKRCNTQKTAPTSAATSASTTRSAIMDPGLLNLALAWLDPKDVARCTQVCTQWKRGIEQYTWKQAAQNVKPEAFQALQSAMDSSQKNISFKALATGLMHYQEPPPPLEIPDPSIQLEDLFLLVELDVCGQKKAWCKNLKSSSHDDGDFELISYFTVKLVGDDESASDGEFHFPPHLEESFSGRREYDKIIKLFDNMLLTLSLWRADTGQSFCLCSKKRYHNNMYTEEEDPATGFEFRSEQTRPVGKLAMHLCQINEYRYICPEGQVFMEQVPATEAESVSKYRICNLDVLMIFCVGEDEYVNVSSLRDLLLFLEGLDWK